MDHCTTRLSLALLLLSLASTQATLFRLKWDQRPEPLDHWKGKRALEHPQFAPHAPFFGLAGLEHLFGPSFALKHAVPVAYAVPKLIPIAHPVPVTVERPVAIPVPVHLGKALGEYAPSAYDAALANYVSLTQHQTRPQYVAPVYEQPECHPYCDINLPQGSSPVPLATREKRLRVQTLGQGQGQGEGL